MPEHHQSVYRPRQPTTEQELQALLLFEKLAGKAAAQAQTSEGGKGPVARIVALEDHP